MTCGGGEQTRNRTCEDPLYGGLECIGFYSEIQTCNEDNCPGTLYALSPGWYHSISVSKLRVNITFSRNHNPLSITSLPSHSDGNVIISGKIA